MPQILLNKGKTIKVFKGIWTIVLGNKQRDFLFMVVTCLR